MDKRGEKRNRRHFVYPKPANKAYLHSPQAKATASALTKTQPQVKYIRATTDKINVASYKVLEKNSFVIIDETETQLHWRLLKPNHDPV